MYRRSVFFCLVFVSHLALASLTNSTTSSLSANAEPTCSFSATWLPITPLPTFETPPPHSAPDCPFYRAGWQVFLYAMQQDANGRPRFLSSYATLSDLFGVHAAREFAQPRTGTLSLAPRIAQFPNEKLLLHTPGQPPGIDSGVNQAGPLRGLLIDQNGNPIYYAIHVNEVYSSFIKANKLTTKAALLAADPEKLEFPEGSVELKSAWQIVDPNAIPSNYFTTKATVPKLKISNGDVVPDSVGREVTVALIAIHVVFVLKGHPEFIWSTFEHLGADGQGRRDNAPAALANPSNTPGTTVISTSNWPLYKAGTTAPTANLPNSPQDRVNSFDEKTQKFAKGGVILQTSVYRMFPGSKSGIEIKEDEDVAAVNTSAQSVFGSAPGKADVRRNYQLVGAIWLDNPGRDFRANVLFQNQDGQSTDADGAMVAGEDRLSSTAMESFTQSEDSRPNCFSCHNTRRVTDDRTGTTIIPGKRLNVSHVLSKFVSELP
jgi:hypothetical protein